MGATTRSGLLTAPLRARFGINLHLEYYDAETLQRIITRSANILKVPIDAEAASELPAAHAERLVLPMPCCVVFATLHK